MAALAVQRPALAGTAVTYAAAAGGGDTFDNDGKTLLHVKNGGGGSINVTANASIACNQGHDHDAVVAVPAGGERIIGPFPLNQFGPTVSLTYSGVTSVTAAAVGA